MPCQEADIRRRNFREVAIGFTEERALLEAQRCISCKNPTCFAGCPVESERVRQSPEVVHDESVDERAEAR